MARPSKAWADASDRIVSESSEGGMEVFVLLSRDVAILELRAHLGDQTARMLLEAGDMLIARTKRTPKRKRPLCLCCPTRINDGFAAMVFALPITAAPTTSLGMFMCLGCGRGLGRKELETKARDGLFTSWPGLQELPNPTHPEGGTA